MPAPLLSISDLCNRLKLSRSTLTRLRQQPDFPKPALARSTRSQRWREDQIEQWLARSGGEVTLA